MVAEQYFESTKFAFGNSLLSANFRPPSDVTMGKYPNTKVSKYKRAVAKLADAPATYDEDEGNYGMALPDDEDATLMTEEAPKVELFGDDESGESGSEAEADWEEGADGEDASGLKTREQSRAGSAAAALASRCCSIDEAGHRALALRLCQEGAL